MLYLKLTNGVPENYSIGKLRRDNPNTSFPKTPSDALLADWDVYPYTRPSRPEYDPMTWNLVDGPFEQDADGNWSMGYVLEALPLEQASQNVRSARDRKLQDCDWVVIKNTEKGTNIPLEWELYRQQLRDVPSQPDFPYNVSWPTEPTVPAT